MILAKAKIIDRDYEVKGFLFSEWNKHNECEDYFICEQSTLSVETNADHIDEDTLKYSLDNGESWYSEEELNRALSFTYGSVTKVEIIGAKQ